MIAQKPSLIVVDRNDVPLLAVEIDNQKNLNVEKAVDFRQEVLPQLGGAYTPYLMLVSQDRAFLWEDSIRQPANAPPTAEIPMKEIVAEYASKHTMPEAGSRITARMLRRLVERWLEATLSNGENGVLTPAFLRPLARLASGGWVKRGSDY